MNSSHKGYVSRVMGPVVDVRFEDGYLPDINNAVQIKQISLRNYTSTPFVARNGVGNDSM